MDPEMLHTCSTCPSRGLTRVFFPPFLFFAEKYWAKVVHISRNVSTDEKPSEKNKHRVGSSQEHIEDVQNFTVWIEKTAWTFAGE